MVFYIVDLFFTQLDCMPDQNGWWMPEWMITSTISLDEPKFYMNLVNFDVVVYVTHSVTANNIKEE